MPDIELMGAVYPGVPSVILPRSGGGAAQFFDMSDDMAFLGAGVECVDDALYSATFQLSDTSYNGWTPSTTAKAIVASTNISAAFTASDLENYEYFLVWECGVDPVYTGTPTQKALAILSRGILVQEILRRPGSWSAIESGSFATNACVTANTSNFLRYYGTTTGSATYTWSASYGFYFAATAATFSSTTANSPTVTVKTPTCNTRCSTTYFSTTSAAAIDQENSTGFIRGKVYRVKKNGFVRGIYNQVVSLINEEA